MDYKELREHYPKRHLTKIVNVTKRSPLRLTEILVYSCLVDRATHNKGARQKQVSRATSLHESTAVPAALHALQRHALVEKRGPYWWAVEPGAGTLPWFQYRKGTEGQKWASRFSYWWTGVRKPKTPLTGTQVALYFKLVNLTSYNRRITKRGLSKLLGVDVKTVIGGVKKLQSVNLVDADLYTNVPTADQLKWFKLRREKPAFVLSERFAPVFATGEDEAVLSKPLVDRAGQLLVGAGISERQVVNYFQTALKLAKRWPVVYAFVSNFEDFYKSVEGQHQNNVAAGKYAKATNCLGLLSLETKKRLKGLATARCSGR